MKHSTLRGADLHSPSTELVENNSGSTIPKFRAVTFSNIGTAYPQITVANGTIDLIRGITQSDIANGAVGKITALGFLNDVDTSAWAPGTKLYAHSGGVLQAAAAGLPVGIVLKQHATTGVVYIENTGVTKGDLEALQFPDALSLELQWFPNNPAFYTEPTYDVNNNITQVNIYDTSAKTFHIFNKTYTYNVSNQITKVEITRVFDNIKITKLITYNVNGFITSVTRTYTP